MKIHQDYSLLLSSELKFNNVKSGERTKIQCQVKQNHRYNLKMSYNIYKLIVDLQYFERFPKKHLPITASKVLKNPYFFCAAIT